MIRVTVDLLPFGSEDDKRTIGVLEIANDGKTGPHYGDYDYSLVTVLAADRGGPVRGRVINHRRASGVWELIRRALTDALKKEGV